MNYMDKIIKKAGEFDIPVVAVADAERLNLTAPTGFRPGDYLSGARSVVILARQLPKSVFVSGNDPHYMFYTRAFADNYRRMNDAACTIATMLESEGFPSLAVPAYSPLKFYRGEPCGMISFKHAAAEAGIGKLGKNTIFIHPEHGNILRLGGLITRCMTNCIGHTLLPPYPIQSSLRWMAGKVNWINSFMEYFTTSMFENYGIRCMECLLICPHFPCRKQQK